MGCGAISSNYADALTKNEHVDLVCVCDINKEKAAKVANKYKCRYYTDYSEMLKSEDINVVHICTPHYLHASMSIEAMQSGKHVLTEKPMAISVSDAQAMIKVSKETGKRLGVCFQNRFNATSVRIKEALESGEVGKVIGAKGFVTWHRDAAYYINSGWRGSFRTEGGGVLINQSINGTKFSIDGEQGITAIKLIHAIYASEENKQYVKLSSIN